MLWGSTRVVLECGLFSGSGRCATQVVSLTGLPNRAVAAQQLCTGVALSEVSCEFCENKLGVTYVVAPDARNQYKAAVLEFQLPKHPELNCKL